MNAHPFIVWLCLVKHRDEQYERLYNGACRSPGAFSAPDDDALWAALLENTAPRYAESQMLLEAV